MDNPHISRSRGLSKRRQVANMDRVNPQSNNLLDNRAVGIARLIATHKLNGDFQTALPIDSRKQSQAVSFSNNANQIANGTYSDNNVVTRPSAERKRRRRK